MSELKAMQSTSDSTELQGLLKTAHADRDRLEVELSELKQELLEARAETERARDTIAKVGGDETVPFIMMSISTISQNAVPCGI